MPEGVGGGGAWVDKNFALALTRLKKKERKKKKEIQSALSKKDSLRTGPYCPSWRGIRL